MTTAVLRSQNRAITIARDAATARVVTLELLAAQVAAAEAARRDWETAHLLAARNDKYLDLVARTAADQHATVEITGLAEQAAEAARAYRETLQQATLAAEALALPLVAVARGSTSDLQSAARTNSARLPPAPTVRTVMGCGTSRRAAGKPVSWLVRNHADGYHAASNCTVQLIFSNNIEFL